MPSIYSTLLPRVLSPRLVAFDHCRIPLGHFAFVRRNDEVAQLHRLALAVDPQAPVRVSWFDRLVAYFTYAVISLRQIRKYHSVFGDHVMRGHGISHFRQWRDLWHCMWRQNQCARHYYWRKLFLQPDRTRWLDNLEHRQVNTMLDHLNSHVAARRISHKVQFAEHCRIHGLATPANVAVWDQGGQLLTPAPADPHVDLFMKPMADFGSVGAMPLVRDRIDGRYRLGTTLLSWGDLLETIAAKHTRRTGYVMQRRLRNSPAAAVYGDDDVCNLRIVTGRPVQGEPVPIAAVVRLPSSFTTQGHDRHVLLATVDLATGRMGPGVFRDIKLPQFTHHPDTGYPITGRLLPRWTEMLTLALAAHRTCPWMPFVGWDVVDSDQGLLLLEANANWGGDSAQLPGAPALGQTPFTGIFLEWFEHFKSARLAPSPVPAASAKELQPASRRA